MLALRIRSGRTTLTIAWPWLVLACIATLYMCSCSAKDHDCYDGCGDTSTGEPGETGEPGASGSDGEAGRDGENCTVSTGSDGCTSIQCGVSTASICTGIDGQAGASGAPGRDGVAGVDGTDGVDAQAATVVTPCPETAGSIPYPERFIRFADGTTVAFYSSPDYMQQRLVTLVTGATYVTTDGRACVFVAE